MPPTRRRISRPPRSSFNISTRAPPKRRRHDPARVPIRAFRTVAVRATTSNVRSTARSGMPCRRIGPRTRGHFSPSIRSSRHSSTSQSLRAGTKSDLDCTERRRQGDRPRYCTNFISRSNLTYRGSACRGLRYGFDLSEVPPPLLTLRSSHVKALSASPRLA
jgi:hypothetical protein